MRRRRCSGGICRLGQRKLGCRLGSLRRIVSVWDGSSAVLAVRARLGFLRRGRGPQRLAGAEGAASVAKWH